MRKWKAPGEDPQPDGLTMTTSTVTGPEAENHPSNDSGISIEDDNGKFVLHPNDPINFLKLCSALRILVKWTLTCEDVDKAGQLIREYNQELITVSPHGITLILDSSYKY